MSVVAGLGVGWFGPIVRPSDVFYLQYKYGVCYAVGGMYAAVCLLSVVFLLVEFMNNSTSKSAVCTITLKHVGLLLIFLDALIAALFWIFSAGTLDSDARLYTALWVFPVAIFILAVLCLLHMYATVYYEIQLSPKFDQQKRQQIKKRRSLVLRVIAGIVLIYHAVIVVLIVVPKVEFIQMILCVASCFVGAAFFPICSIYLLTKKKKLMGNRTRSRRAKLRLIQLGSVGWLLSVCLFLRGISFMMWHVTVSFERSLYWIYAACIQLALEIFPLVWLSILMRVVKETDVEVTSYGDTDSGLYFTSQSESTMPTINGQEFLLLPESTSQ